LQRITPSRLTPSKIAPVRSTLVKFVGGISELLSLAVVTLILLPSNPYHKKIAPTKIAIRTNFFILPLAKVIFLEFILNFTTQTKKEITQ
jgi:hypothetical protein